MRRWIYVLLPVIVLGSLIIWRLQKKEQEALAQSQQRQARTKAPVVVTAAPANERDIVETFEASGTIESPINVKLSAKTAGRIEMLQAREGDRVHEGEVLARLDTSDIDAEVARQRALVAEARSRLAQAMITQSPTETAVTTQIREREAELATAEADRDQVKQNSASRKAAMFAAVQDAQGRINDAEAAIASAEASIRSAQANLTNAKSKLRRVEDLYAQGFIAAQDVDDAKTAVAVQEQDVDVARGKLAAANAQKTSMIAQKDAAQKQYEIGQVTTIANQKSAEARVKQARASLESARANVAQKPAYRENIAALRASVDAAEAAVRSAQARKDDTILRSPVAGSVTARYLDPGSLATPGQPIVAIQTESRLWVTFSAPEETSRKIRSGMRVAVSIDSLPAKTLDARVVQINPSADPASRQVQVRAALTGQSNSVKPGMFARVRVEVDRLANAIVVPREAVQESKNGPEVVVVGDDKIAHKRPVSLGPADASSIAIRSGLQKGEVVVNLSASPVKEGATVRVSEAKTASASSQTTH